MPEIKKMRYETMDEMVTHMDNLLSKDRDFPVDPSRWFPLSDESSTSADWKCVLTQKFRGDCAKAWANERSLLSPQLAVRDFCAVLAYEADGAKLEKNLGWSALSQWFMGVKDMRTSDWPLTVAQMFDKVEELIQTGASVAAFQAAHPNALSEILDWKSETGRQWGCVELLLDNGWNPNKLVRTTPNRNEHLGLSSMQSLLANGHSRKDAHLPTEEERVAAWVVLIAKAQKAGFDLNSRSMSGESSLGLCLSHRGYDDAYKAEPDPRVKALIRLGADVKKTARFWVTEFEQDPANQAYLLSLMERDELGRASDAGVMDSGNTAVKKAVKVTL